MSLRGSCSGNVLLRLILRFPVFDIVLYILSGWDVREQLSSIIKVTSVHVLHGAWIWHVVPL